jgi:hypothetical protein
MSRGEKGTAYLDGLLLSIMVGCSIFSSWNCMKNEVDNYMDGYCSRMKKERKVRATVLVTTKYVQLMASR